MAGVGRVDTFRKRNSRSLYLTEKRFLIYADPRKKWVFGDFQAQDVAKKTANVNLRAVGQ